LLPVNDTAQTISPFPKVHSVSQELSHNLSESSTPLAYPPSMSLGRDRVICSKLSSHQTCERKGPNFRQPHDYWKYQPSTYLHCWHRARRCEWPLTGVGTILLLAEVNRAALSPLSASERPRPKPTANGTKYRYRNAIKIRRPSGPYLLTVSRRLW